MLPSQWPIQIDSEKEITDEINILNFVALQKTSELLLQYTRGYWPYQVSVLDKPFICQHFSYSKAYCLYIDQPIHNTNVEQNHLLN